MAKLKNIAMAGIVLAIAEILKDPATTDDFKAKLQPVVDQLTAEDARLVIFDAENAGKIKELNDQIADFQLNLDKANELLNQPSVVPGLKSQIEQLKAEQDEALEVIEDLKEQLANALTVKAKASDKPVGEFEGEHYVVNSGAHGYGSAQDIANDPAKIGAILAKKGQTIIEKLNA